MHLTDKAVSTEDLNQVFTVVPTFEVGKLETVLTHLLESKAKAIKHEKKVSNLSSNPRGIIHRLRITSTTSSNDEDKSEKTHKKWQLMKQTDSCDTQSSKTGQPCQDASTSSQEAQRILKPGLKTAAAAPHEDFNPNGGYHKGYDECKCRSCAPETTAAHTCCCQRNNAQIRPHYDEDYISLKIEDYDENEEELAAREALRRARRKRRRKRRRRLKKQLAMGIIPPEERIKVLDPDELPPRARWTIIATACLLLFMCLLLVGITLRMAPLIDDMVRMENEQLINAYKGEVAGTKLNISLKRTISVHNPDIT